MIFFYGLNTWTLAWAGDLAFFRSAAVIEQYRKIPTKAERLKYVRFRHIQAYI